MDRNERGRILSTTISGGLCALLGLYFIPARGWIGALIGALAGVSGGWAAYDFKGFLKSVPVAVNTAWEETGGAAKETKEGIARSLRTWFAKPHPFVHFGVFCAILVMAWLTPKMLNSKLDLMDAFGVLVAGWALASLCAYFVGGGFVALMSLLGSRVWERVYWYPTSTEVIYPWEGSSGWRRRMRKKGYCRVRMTYSNAIRWFGLGLLVTMKFFVWTMWKYLGIGLGLGAFLLGRAAYEVYRLGHSWERLLYSVEGTAGGLMSLYLLYRPHMSFMQNMVCILVGMLLGFGLGHIDCKLVAPRILHTTPARA